MPLGLRKRRSESRSSDEESDEKRLRKYHVTSSHPGSHDHWPELSASYSMRHTKAKNTVLVLDCKKLVDDVMLLMHCTNSGSWFTLPLEYRMTDLEHPGRYLTAKNLIGFVKSSVIFWKDEQTLISASLSRGTIECFPSMGTGRCYSSSKWRYVCALNHLFAVNIYNSGETEGRMEKAVVNVMAYSFKDEGWEKLAEHRIKKRIGSNPFVLGTEGPDSLWLCVADYFIDPQSLKLEKHDLHIVSIENQTWGLDALDCSDLSEAYSRSRHFPSLSTNSQGNLCVYMEPVVYTYAAETADWSELEVDAADTRTRTTSVLAETQLLTDLKQYMFKLDSEKDTCEFYCCDLETGESIEHDVPSINMFQKAPHLAPVIQRQSFRISNVIGDAKLTSHRLSENVLKKAIDTDFEQFECEF